VELKAGIWIRCRAVSGSGMREWARGKRARIFWTGSRRSARLGWALPAVAAMSEHPVRAFSIVRLAMAVAGAMTRVSGHPFLIIWSSAAGPDRS